MITLIYVSHDMIAKAVILNFEFHQDTLDFT